MIPKHTRASIHAALRRRQPAEATGDALIWAAVALILRPDPLSLLIIRRADRHGDPWSGHLALPGGRAEAADRDLLETAMRETVEEVGIRLTSADQIGRLDDVAPRGVVIPRVAVRPFVFWLDSTPSLALSSEVAAVEWPVLAGIQDGSASTTFTYQRDGLSRNFPGYAAAEGVIWGMTERILSDFLTRLRLA